MSIKVRIKSMFIRFSSYNGNIVSTNPTSKECSYCKKSFTKQSWCKECDPLKVIEGWTSGNPNVDKFIKDTMYRARHERHPKFLEWVRFDRLGNFKVIGKGGFSKVYSAIWKDGRSEFKQTIDGRWIKRKPKPMEVVLKRLIESENISTQYLHELQIYYGLTTKVQSLELYGMTKHPRTNEYILIFEFANLKSLRRILFNDFRKLLWKEKMTYLFEIIHELDKLHKLGCCHRDLHSGNVLRSQPAKGNAIIYLSDFGLSGTANKESLSENIYGILPYTAPEVLSGKPYTLASDIYSFGVLMIELSSGKPPFYNRKHDLSLILDVYNGVRPEFGKGTPDFYKELACKCMDIDPGKRPTANELCAVLRFWRYTFVLESYRKDTKFGYCGRDIKEAFDKANEEIPNISTSYRRNPDAKYASRLLSLTSSLNHDTSNLI